VLGFLHVVSPGPAATFVAAFRAGLSEAEYVDGQKVAIEFRWAEGRVDRLPELAADLVLRRVNVLATPGNTGPQQAIAMISVKDSQNSPLLFTKGAHR
jgi:putative ABC transport system substrate-binding protein